MFILAQRNSGVTYKTSSEEGHLFIRDLDWPARLKARPRSVLVNRLPQKPQSRPFCPLLRSLKFCTQLQATMLRNQEWLATMSLMIPKVFSFPSVSWLLAHLLLYTLFLGVFHSFTPPGRMLFYRLFPPRVTPAKPYLSSCLSTAVWHTLMPSDASHGPQPQSTPTVDQA